MFSKLVSIALLTALAGRALAFNVSVNKVVYQSTEVFDFNFTPVIASCQTNCNTAKATINACTDIGCFCGNTTITELAACEQCIFTAIVDANVPPPDVRAGSNQVFGRRIALRPTLPSKSVLNCLLLGMALLFRCSRQP
ncbi:hypothetical protein MIND_00330800 [Mycena indigotica]|uniref:Extracellular membrane protein CFEM domain-containing protein n=1 Tax=Mycena indigotica TaxID=2126181 RepID=A0A8H6T0T3_9AGAR|nr:uncharacterized protein MIND_00330800 [Mycena indigotica]KAF7309598.1 hypothetical protein MIND_00330800 [Mycena indigotica]